MLEYEPRTSVVYSDFNFLLLGFVVERVLGMSLADAGENFLFKPLGLSDTSFGVSAEKVPVTAASELGNGYEENVCREMFPEREIPAGTFRREPILGQVRWELLLSRGDRGTRRVVLDGRRDCAFGISISPRVFRTPGSTVC